MFDVLHRGDRVMSDTTADQSSPDARSERYAITVKGHLDPCWSEWFEGLAMAYTESGETILSGPVADQAALHGLLMKIRDLNLTLIAVNRGDTIDTLP
jgi:hypothetical protein